MQIFAISDLHYSGIPPIKPMEIFNPMWEDHRAKIRSSWLDQVSPEDVVLIGGDTSWALKMHDAQADLDELVDLPGQKILIRGNHDYWWQTQAKMTKIYESRLTFLQAGAILLPDGTGIGGTRGWKIPGDPHFREEDVPILARELLRIEMALKELQALPAKRRILFLHFPPVWRNEVSTDISRLLARYPIELCLYGHLHGETINEVAPTKTPEGLPCKLLSCDATDFKLVNISKILEGQS